jgi:phospholipid/cholesterol/gamma-HCH transport system substrate-binding protein
MKRVLGILVLACVCVTFIVLATGAGSADTGANYQVRAIFQNAFSLVPGEDVKIAGVKVGKIDSMDVTPQQTAAVTFTVTRKGFDNWRSDAECTIRPQSLIGEKFIECTPTQPRAVGDQPAPPLPTIPNGHPGAGAHFLGVTHTSRPVDVDLLNNVMRLPYRQRLGIILNEFGTGLAGRGQDLSRIIRNADPALKATDKVLNLLAGQNKVLSDLAKQSAASLRPLARERQHVQGFVVQSAHLATATAEKQPAFQAQFEKLPALLHQLRPTLSKLGSFADQATPVFDDLHAQAPAINRLIKAQGPFAASSTVALKSLGQATIPGTKALVAAKGIVGDLKTFGEQTRPLARNLAALTTSFKNTGGVERLLDYIFYQVAAINGFDSYGHYLRAELIVNLCTTYATSTTKDPTCAANFINQSATRSASHMTAEQALHAPGISLANRRTMAVLRGMSPAEAIRLTSGESDSSTTGNDSSSAAAGATQPTAQQQDASAITSAQSAAPDTSAQGSGAGAAQRLLDYLLGGGA